MMDQKRYFKIINVSRRQLALFLVYLATILFATAGIVSVMSYALVSPGGNNFTVIVKSYLRPR